LAFVVTFCIATLLAPNAKRLRLVDVPNGRKDHAVSTPVVGGIAIFAGVGAGLAPAMIALWDVPSNLLGFGMAAVIVMISGVLDDVYDLRWYFRLAAQTAAALVMVSVGDVRIEHVGALFGLADVSSGPLSVPLTVFATVGMINALNMIDGVDGLAGSLSTSALLMLLAAAVYAGNETLAYALAVPIAAIAAFLCLNLRSPWQKRARVFMGNSGSALLGLLIAWAMFQLTQSPAHPVTPVLAPFFLAVPLVDCIALIVRRLAKRKSPFHADREHVHHLLLDAGVRPSTVVLFLSLLSLVIGLSAAMAFRAGVAEPVLVSVFLGLMVSYAWFTNSRRRVASAVGRLAEVVPWRVLALAP